MQGHHAVVAKKAYKSMHPDDLMDLLRNDARVRGALRPNNVTLPEVGYPGYLTSPNFSDRKRNPFVYQEITPSHHQGNYALTRTYLKNVQVTYWLIRDRQYLDTAATKPHEFPHLFVA